MEIWVKEGKMNTYIVIGKFKSYICTIAGISEINIPKEIIKREGYKNLLPSRNMEILDISEKKNTYLFVSPNRLEVVKYDKSIDIQIIL